MTADSLSPPTGSPSSKDAVLDALDQRMQWYVDENLLSCCESVILRGTDVVHRQRHGVMDRDTGEPLREDAIYRMYSNTKLVTSVAAMMLVEAGQLSLDAPVADWLPGFGRLEVLRPGATAVDQTEALDRPVTLRHLLSHSAGLSYGFIEPDSVIDQAYMAAGIDPLGDRSMTLASLCDKLATLPLVFQPGTQWRYSFASDVTAHLVELASGERFDTFLEKRIFEPLGMVDTGFHVPEQSRHRLITQYMPTDPFDLMDRSPVVHDHPSASSYAEPPGFFSGGGGLVSTVTDYLEFLRLLINDGEWRGVRLLGADTLAEMRRNQLPEGVGVNFPMWTMPDTVFGLGFALKTAPAEGEPPQAVGEYHWGGMAGTHSWVAPQLGLAGFCLTQRMPGFWMPFSHDFKRLAYEYALAAEPS